MTDLSALADDISSCTRCPLHRGRIHAVPGDGQSGATIMLVGEAPGREEDRQGRPFVGKAGRILDEALHAAALKREELYITNVVKCRPPGNRNPRQEEVEACLPYLESQINLIRPRILCTLGRVATEEIFPRYGLQPVPLARIHGTAYEVRDTPGVIVPVYHPAATIYNPALAEVFMADIKKIARLSEDLR
ncbi:MAG TPA: uracil-DNA glycosylase [Thermoplasmatales archaeon]|nr:uracil-DNA glycosylase [Thermoplasmatales archaeon]